jgi:hypothetical protein
VTEQLNDEDLHRKAARASLATRAFLLFVGISLALLLLVTAVIVGQIRHQQGQSYGTLQSANAAARSAQETGEPCFERSQRHTASAVSSINRVVILAAACAVGRTGTVAEIQTQIQACVINGLARQSARGNR